MDAEQWREKLQFSRFKKDLFFVSHPRSPLSPRQRHVFRGLAYWPPDPEYRFELVLNEHVGNSLRNVRYTAGGSDRLISCGEFRFKIR